MGLLGALQFTNFALLGAAALAPLLILAYLKRTPLRRSVVSSLMVLKQLTQRRPQRRRVKLPLRFFLELLALLLLALAAAGPMLRSDGEHVALVIDNSLSMRALDRAAAGKKTRFDEATEAAADFLAGRSRADTYTVYVTSPKLQRVGEERVSWSEARETVRNLKPTFTSDSVQVAAGELLENGVFDRLQIFADYDAEYLEGKSGAGAFQHTTKLEVHRVGSAAPNVYLANLRSERSASRPDGIDLLASIGFSGAHPADIQVSLNEIRRGGEEALVSTQTVKAQPERTVDAIFTVPTPRSADTAYHVRLRVEAGPAGSEAEDALAEDNEGWIAPEAKRGAAFLLVNPESDQRAALGLDTLRGVTLRVVRPEEYGALTAADLGSYSLVMFYRSAPAFAPKVPTLLLLPPAENALFPVQREVSSPSVSSWVNEHPITAYLRALLIQPAAAQIFSVPAWAQPIINVEQGCIVAAGESQGVRFAASGVELLPFEGASSPVSSVLLLNLISWLTGGADLSQAMLAGSTMRLEAGRRWSVTDPAGRGSEFVPSGQEPHIYTFENPGIYRVRSADQSGRTLSDEQVEVNIFNPDESSTFTLRTLRVPRSVSADAAMLPEQSAWWPRILAAALALLLCDLLLQSIRPVARGAD